MAVPPRYTTQDMTDAARLLLNVHLGLKVSEAFPSGNVAGGWCFEVTSLDGETYNFEVVGSPEATDGAV